MMNKSQVHLQNRLYRYLLSAGGEKEPDIFLPELLELFVSITGASQGYLELRDSRGNTFWASQRFNDGEIQNIRNAISKGIVAEVLKERKLVKTVSAVSDPRFSSRESVRSAQIEAVLCVPIHAHQVHGVIYLQGRDGFRPDAEETIRDARLIVDHIAPLTEEIYFHRELAAGSNHTAYLREQYPIAGIIGRSKALARVLKTALMIAPLDLNVILTGESGTGKTQFAEMIHKTSSRKEGPFVEVNCAALPETLLENELFGAAKGGHSGAIQSVQGKVAAAEGGTLFLDEIGELPMAVQAKLLQLLQSGLYYPLGSSRPVKADIRVITATNVNLHKAVKEKRFREDLLYRINVFSIHMPPLSERETDLVDLAGFFCKESCKKHGLPELAISPAVSSMLCNRTWRGNIRELKHAVEAATIHATLDGKKEIAPRHLLQDHPNSVGQGEHISNFKEATLLFQRQFLKRNLEIRNWNVSRTAKDISLSRSQLNNLIGTFQLKRNGRQRDSAALYTECADV